ncbi:LPS biosynthesis choline kinase [Reinekea blandensis]|uniref:Predicted choline kinase involved in LPS biosynthesis n=1 Tax=Reinekea blandensis MED297 TaxID=314283 RepID=A4BCA2_9GAMM|nr:LPS biosynthesis choline kinase [Reinekea blandensis]EAR10168.1 predicted choline kinase involved in LPS biosynthesis [Reinekea sp. MED297] [Reinekea blandensis MED297]
MHFHEVLRQLDPIVGPDVQVSRIDHALTNACYRLETPTERYVLRLNNPLSKSMGIDRHRERLILESIASKPFAPLTAGISEDWLLSRWIPEQPSALITSTDALTTLLDDVHAVDIPDTLPPLLVTDQIQHLSQHQQQPLDPAELRRIERACQNYQPPLHLVLCHHDWHPGNLLGTDEQPVLIDWEYAAPGDPAIDLACLCHGMKLDQTTAASLARNYDLPGTRWRQAIALTQLMSELWYGVRFPKPPNTAILDIID